MQEVQQVLNDLTIDGKIVRLPEGQLDRKLYEGVKKALEGIGGKWKGGKTQGFEFAHDPSELIGKLQGGDRVHLKKEFQFFPTPKAVATTLCRFAEVEKANRILEPSAGQGAIVDAIRLLNQSARIDCYELMEQNQDILSKRVHLNLVGDDFLKARPQPIYNCIVANPPFTKNQDIDHVRHMHAFLAPGGKLSSVMSKHFTFSEGKKETEFRDWLEEVGADIVTLPAGTFKESGTMIETVIVTITK